VPDTRFGDVAGVDEVVAELSEIAEFLHRPDPFEAAGARIPRGFLLIGPPGTGKTLLARAVAGEAGVPFFALSGSDFVETFVGVGAARVRRLFDEARRTERAIIFIDELDAIGRARASGTQPGANDERESTLNQLLVEMDGFRRSNIIVLAATNRPDVLDPALLRPGRFDRRITVAPPDRRGRTAILELHSTSYHLGGDVDLPTLARRTPGMTGADLAFLINEAALTAARQGRVDITQQHVEAALAVTVLGRERPSAVIMERDRRITAWHEAGHAVAALVEPDADDPVQITIVPRGQAGGVTWMAGNDHALVTRREASARLVVALAGRAAEELLLDGDFTQGAANDFAHATRLASDMVTQYGMSPLGVASISPEHLAYGTQADRVNTAVSQLLDEALDLARTLLQVNSGLVRAVAEQLLVDETVTLDDMLRLRQQARADF
jgi:cell division protease FtsH